MKKNSKFILKEISGQSILLPFGEMAINFNGMITLNDTAKYLWENLTENFNEESAVNLLLNEYDVTREIALEASKKFIDTLKEVGAIE